MFVASEDSSSTRRLERPTRRKPMATSAGRSPRFRVPHNRPSATRMGVIPIIRESSHSLEKSAPLFRLWAASTVSIAKDRRDITSASDSSASSSRRNRTTAAMLVIKLVPKPNAEDRYRHHGEGEKDPKGGYAYAAASWRQSTINPVAAPNAGFHTDRRPGRTA